MKLMRISLLPSMAVDSYLQVCFYEGTSQELSEEPKLCWEQTGFGSLFSLDIWEISVGSITRQVDLTRSNPSSQIQNDRKCPGKGTVEMSGRLVGATTNCCVAVRLVVDASENYVLSSLCFYLLAELEEIDSTSRLCLSLLKRAVSFAKRSVDSVVFFKQLKLLNPVNKQKLQKVCLW